MSQPSFFVDAAASQPIEAQLTVDIQPSSAALRTPANPWDPAMPPSWLAMEQALRLPRANGVNQATVCLDDHPPEVMNRTALIWVGAHGEEERWSFRQLSEASNRFANALTTLGIQRGDRVFVYLDRVPELAIAFFGALKVGAIVGPLFAAFGTDAIADRLQDAGARLVVTSPSMKPRLDAVRTLLPALEQVVVVQRRSKGYAPLAAHEHDFHTLLQAASPVYTVAYTHPDTPSIMHYTSGTTGKPKGAVHRHGAVVAQAATARYVLDLDSAQDVYWCTADPGWVTGTSYGLFGPWALGVTQLMFEGHFQPEAWYGLLERYGVTVWYTAPTAIRMLMKAGDALVHQYDLSRLRHVCSVGEPLNPEAVVWGQQVLQRTFYDTWWQTETGAIHITNHIGLPVKPGSMGKPFPGVEAAVLNDQFEPLPPGSEGALALKLTAPSRFLTYWNNASRYDSRFKNGWYLTGDRARLDADGYFWFVGREDDVINTAGHLVGPFEVESALVEHPAVAEAAVIGIPDPERMEVIKAFIALKAGVGDTAELRQDIQQFVRHHLAAHAYPRVLEVVPNLPKTRSGKIMRRLLKARELGLPEGDLSTLEEG